MWLDKVVSYWPLLSALGIMAGLAVYYGFRMWWKIKELQKENHRLDKDRQSCESRCKSRVNDLQIEYADDLKEIRTDLKETVKLSQSMNLSLTKLTAFLHGKGVIDSVGE